MKRVIFGQETKINWS